jgi:hypothetical protein
MTGATEWAKTDEMKALLEEHRVRHKPQTPHTWHETDRPLTDRLLAPLTTHPQMLPLQRLAVEAAVLSASREMPEAVARLLGEYVHLGPR